MTPECLILGGGLSGSMAALRLATAGRKTVLLEKEKLPHHKVCGEFLSAEAVGYLRQAGIDPLLLGAAPIQFLRLSVGKRVVETKLPFTALSLSRHILDEALLARAAEEGCVIRRGETVKSLAFNREAGTACLSSGESLTAPAVFLATGKHDLRGWTRSQGMHTDLIGFKLHWRLPPAQTAALHNVMELFLFPGGYGGFALVEQGIANLCLVVRKPVLRSLGGWPSLLKELLAGNARLGHCLHAAQPLWDRPLAVSPIPYGHLGCDATETRLWPLGDQIAVIPSFTGDGMSIALHSAALAATAYLAGSSPATYQRQLVNQLRRGMKIAVTLSRACVHPLPQQAAPVALALFPQAIRWIAAATRIPAAALATASRRPVENLSRGKI